MSDPQNSVAAAPESQSSIIVSRFHLPDDWSGKGACPVCRTRGQLRVQHEDIVPDRMVCGACGAAFEVEMGGARIRLATVPPALAANTAELLATWLTPTELLMLVERATPAGSGSPFEQPAAPPPGAPSIPSETTASRTPTAPLAPKPANGLGAEPGAEPGDEASLASLAAAIGGLAPAKPPPDSVLADELERALTSRPEPGANLGAEPAPDPMAAIANDIAMPAATEPAVTTNASPATLGNPNPSDGKLADGSSERIGQTAPDIVPGPAAPDEAGPREAVANVAGPNIATSTVIASGTPSAAAPGSAPGAKVTALVPASDATATAVARATARPARVGATTGPELAERAWKLHELGNSLPSIQAALVRSGGTPDDISVIMAKLVAVEQARQARFRRTVLWAVGGSLLALVVLLFVTLLVRSFTAPASGIFGSLSPATPTLSPAELATADAKKSKLPPWVSTLVPSSLAVSNAATPSIDPNGPPASPCPTTSDAASALFGGPAASWTFNRQQQRWIFILADNPTSIRLPRNTSAGYLVSGDSLEMRSVPGPATIHNVNFVAVSCN